MRNNKLTLDQKFEIIDLYFDEDYTILEVAGLTNTTKSVVGRVVKLHKEKHINGNADYISYSKHYYRKNRELITIKSKLTKLMNKEIDLHNERKELAVKLAAIDEALEDLIENKYNLLNR